MGTEWYAVDFEGKNVLELGKWGAPGHLVSERDRTKKGYDFTACLLEDAIAARDQEPDGWFPEDEQRLRGNILCRWMHEHAGARPIYLCHDLGDATETWTTIKGGKFVHAPGWKFWTVYAESCDGWTSMRGE